MPANGRWDLTWRLNPRDFSNGHVVTEDWCGTSDVLGSVHACNVTAYRNAVS